jgi:hypothetical protein
MAAVKTVAPSLGIELTPVNVIDMGEIERSVAAFARAPNGGMIVTGSSRAVLPRAETDYGSCAGIWALSDSRLLTRRVALWAGLVRLDRTACRRANKRPRWRCEGRAAGAKFLLSLGPMVDRRVMLSRAQHNWKHGPPYGRSPFVLCELLLPLQKHSV